MAPQTAGYVTTMHSPLKLFQVSAFLLHSYAYFYLFFLRQHNYDYGYGGQFKFFTVWTHTLNVLFYTLSVFNILSDNAKAWLFKLSFVSSVCVSLMFWGVQLLIDPDAFQLDPRNYPAWLNHAQHTAPCIIALLEMSLVHYAYHSILLEIPFVFGYALGYFSFAYRAKIVSGRYPYPFMDSFTDVTTYMWFGFITCVIAVLVHVIGRTMSAVVHRDLYRKPVLETQLTPRKNNNDSGLATHSLTDGTTRTTEEASNVKRQKKHKRGLLASIKRRHQMIIGSSSSSSRNPSNAQQERSRSPLFL